MAGDVVIGNINSVYLVKTDTAYSTGCDEAPLALYLLPHQLDSNRISTESAMVLTVTPFPMVVQQLNFTLTLICAPWSVSETDQSPGFPVYPNPSSDFCTVAMDAHEQNSALVIYDVEGRVVHQEVIIRSETVLNTALYSPGMYLITIRSGAGTQSVRIVVE